MKNNLEIHGWKGHWYIVKNGSRININNKRTWFLTKNKAKDFMKEMG